MTTFRPESWDANIWKSVVEGNEYGISGKWEGDVLDVGAHIGSFTYYAIEKLGARVVVAVEPDANNFALLTSNLQTYIGSGRVMPMNFAVSNAQRATLESEAIPIQNTGGVHYIPDENGEVACIRLDELLSFLRPPVLLKIDCEGCEFEALQTAGNLDAITAIVGEYHCGRGDGNTLTLLRDLLVSRGFEFSNKGDENIGLFGAHRP